jgi:hypothetical protein
VLLVDVAPEQGDQTAESQTDKILKGLDEMIRYVQGLMAA